VTATRTIDVKGLGHSDKHRLIFPGLESLRDNETLRIVVEFNPSPLVTLLKSDGVFDVRYEKDGPDEWVLQVSKIAGSSLIPQNHQEEKNNMVELDLRQIMPFERHELIFEKWEALPPGDTLRIINDHDPKPLRYQFEVEHKDHYEWQYEQQGPKDWMVSIKKK
jgi:uncharacterized protein (DUF2249 family)